MRRLGGNRCRGVYPDPADQPGVDRFSANCFSTGNEKIETEEAKRLSNLFEHIPATLPEELVQTLHERTGCRVERIVSRGHRTAEGQWYDQETDEWVVLLSGKAGLRIEGRNDILVLEPGDYLVLPAHEKHRVEYTDPDADTLWLAVHFAPDVK